MGIVISWLASAVSLYKSNNIPIGDRHGYIIVGVDEFYAFKKAKEKSFVAGLYKSDRVLYKSSCSMPSPTFASTPLSDDSLLVPIFESNPSKVAEGKDSFVAVKKLRKKLFSRVQSVSKLGPLK